MFFILIIRIRFLTKKNYLRNELFYNEKREFPD